VLVSRGDGPTPGPLEWLLDTSHRAAPADVGRLAGEALRRAGARASGIYLVDHDQSMLHPLASGPGHGGGEGSFPVDGTVGGRAFAHESTVSVALDDGVRLWVPLLDGTARVGVLSVDVDGEEPVDAGQAALISRCAALVTELIVTKGRYSDVFELVRRHREMTLEAELQRSIVPPVALVTDALAVAGMLLPAYKVAGDTFDYALDEDRLQLAVIDSVGHELESSVLSHLVSGSLRNSRRNGDTLEGAYLQADAAVARVFPDTRFATAAFGSLDLATGSFRWVSAGHPPPLLARRGKATSEVPVKPVVPIGLGGTHPHVNEVVLEPGDHLFLYTDGATESGPRGGERFGIERLTDMLGRCLLDGLPLAETVRRLVLAVLEHSEHRLQDDTTVLLVEYRATARPELG
jgi:serine phosphatase RsbU (regulator of sigma subunit)